LFFHSQCLPHRGDQSLKSYQFFLYYSTNYTTTGAEPGSALALALDAP